MFSLRDLGAELAQRFAGDLGTRDIALVIRDKDGKDKHRIIIPDPIVLAIFDWMRDEGNGKDLLQRMVDGVYDYPKGEDEIVVVSMSLDGKGSRSLPLGGAFGARLIYKKLFADAD